MIVDFAKPFAFSVFPVVKGIETGCIFDNEAGSMIVKLFGITREIIGDNKLSLETSDNIQTVGDLKKWLSQRYPALQELRSLAVAVDNEYANDSFYIHKSSEVALIPPVSGG